MAIGKGNYGAVCSRSGFALRGIVVNNAPGIIDSNYRGEVKVILYNQTNNAFRVRVGDRVAQLIICSYLAPEIRCVSVLDDTERGSNGFGSSGI
jgi:dUTP pyrophosphatase